MEKLAQHADVYSELNVDADKLHSRCFNCYRKFTKNCLPSRQFYYEFYDSGVQVKKNIQIAEAIKEIYEWRLFGLADSALTLEESFGMNQLRVCGNVCGVAIAKLYGAIKVFDSLAHSSSVLESFTKKLLDKFISIAGSQSLVGCSPNAKRKVVPNLLTRKSRKSNEEDGIGKEILNRPVTQHLKVEKGGDTQEPQSTLEEDTLIRILDPEEYQVQEVVIGPESDELRGANFILVTPGDEKPESNNYSNSVTVLNSGDEKDGGGDDWMEEVEVDLDDAFRDSTVSKPFLCQLCGAGLTSRQGLRTHELLTHKLATGKEKIFPCEYCGKEFFFEYLLKNHLPRHVGTRDFACSICDLKFKGRISLRQHVKDVHSTVERKFVCKICPNKAFKHQRTLWDHNKSHHGNKGKKVIFACKFGCGSTTSRTRSLLHHHRICLKRPREELDLAVKSIGGGTLPEEELEKLDDGGKRMRIYACTWDCGKVFTTKLYRTRHSSNVCRKRPNQAKTKTASAKPQARRKVPDVNRKEVGEVDSSKIEFLDSPQKTNTELILRNENHENAASEMESIEVETVFDETIIIP